MELHLVHNDGSLDIDEVMAVVRVESLVVHGTLQSKAVAPGVGSLSTSTNKIAVTTRLRPCS